MTRHQSRNATIDIARGIGIILVVLGHNSIVLEDKGELFRVIYSFHLPLFFFLSGVFLKDSAPLGSVALSRADALLKPYFVVLLLLGAVEMLLPQASPIASTSPLAYLSGVLYATTPTIAWTPLWFLPHLFVASVVSVAILRVTRPLKNRETWLALITGALLAAGIAFIDRFWQIDTARLHFMGLDKLPGLPWSLDLAFLSTACMLAGFILRKAVTAMRFSPVAFVLAVLAFALLHVWFDETIDLNLRAYGNPLVCTVQAALGIYIVLGASALLQRYATFRRSLSYAGSASLFILLFHYGTQGRTFLVLSHISDNAYLLGAASLAAGVLLPLIILELVRRQRCAAVLLLPLRTALPSSKTSPENCHN
jgi:fucose 4-O-acetylase-like acetyltransferase